MKIKERFKRMHTDLAAVKLSTTDCKIVLLPIGSCEQHGPYLPIDTDLRIAQLIAIKLTEMFSEDRTLLLPAIPFSASWEHKGLGTIALNVSTIANVLHDIARSLKTWEIPIVLILINWHGGNSLLASLGTEITASESIATATIQTIGLASQAWHERYPDDSFEDDIHAGALETSVIKAYWPELLTDPIEQSSHYAPDIAPVQFQTALQAMGIRAVTPNGIWGNPERADPGKGKFVIDTTVKRAQEEIAKLVELVSDIHK